MAPKTQIQKFRETAREIEADESEERLDEALRKIAKSRPAEASKGDDNPKSK